MDGKQIQTGDISTLARILRLGGFAQNCADAIH